MDTVQTRFKTNNYSSLVRNIKQAYKRVGICLLFLTLLVFTSCNDSGNDANAKKDIAAAVETLNNALVDPNEELLKSITLPQLTYCHSSGVVQNQHEFMDQLLHGDFDFISVNTSDQSIHVSGDTAIVRHIMSIEGNNAGQPASVRIGIMLVYQKQGGNWLLLARQAYKL
ncbi:nuclear transport factor 2 family protein [Flavobacteriaceae bacterium F89]|uniref:Nuclear transport factor 2 family protein n=1 Tax=Cerina litoralis TaxID=2874477 RepID=A0AAE3ESM5_9FLAO|nr:nuclear transport factor 2 family protein [Cerina litoralis]MCG2460340.1 nuclear transport factor 2 family protein [Cerina litoralis]